MVEPLESSSSEAQVDDPRSSAITFSKNVERIVDDHGRSWWELITSGACTRELEKERTQIKHFGARLANLLDMSYNVGCSHDPIWQLVMLVHNISVETSGHTGKHLNGILDCLQKTVDRVLQLDHRCERKTLEEEFLMFMRTLHQGQEGLLKRQNFGVGILRAKLGLKHVSKPIGTDKYASVDVEKLESDIKNAISNGAGTAVGDMKPWQNDAILNCLYAALRELAVKDEWDGLDYALDRIYKKDTDADSDEGVRFDWASFPLKVLGPYVMKVSPSKKSSIAALASSCERLLNDTRCSLLSINDLHAAMDARLNQIYTFQIKVAVGLLSAAWMGVVYVSNRLARSYEEF